ncbi:Pentatricopeptide repeat-containing protein [Raphanus sativus]|uniref:Pentatricopeptide repeat-containing protein At1g32415, mitochondrial n=1 Tax=Raphanus sativus TaxID=3726 RepID=A0A6J0K036_RAPSA|nr:pentatricopeptide repeat-containing protein At1g32415, mitochondrial [Raphanus sativus]KAJ4917075.1 Pentatricopeptide repeat-containing protein [Raphanus sativus]
MRALCVKKVYSFLSKLSLASSVYCRRYTGHAISNHRTHHRGFSNEEALILRRLSEGGLVHARHLLDKIPQRGSISRVRYWTSLLTKFAKAGYLYEARALFQVMPERNIVTCNAMLTSYVRCRRLDEAWTLFREMPKDVVSWTVMLTALCDDGRSDDAVELFDEMPERNVVSWNTLVSGLIKNGDMEKAKQVFDAMPSRDVVSWNAMIKGYIENDGLEEAKVLFGSMSERNVVTWTSMVSGYCRYGDVHEAYRLFCEMPERNVVSWTAMIGGFAWNEFHREALLLFLDMKKDLDAVLPNDETLISLAYACGGLGAGFHCLGQQLHAQVISNGWESVDRDGRLAKSLVHMYASSGLIGSAQYLLNESFDLQSCNIMINGYLRTGDLERAQTLFQQVECLHDKVSWTSMINGYLDAGDVSRAFDLFHELHDKDGVTWTVMISGLVRNELFAEAASLLSDMMRHGLKPLNSTYSVLLSSAGATSNLDQGKHLHCVIAKTTACYDPDLILQNSLVSMYAKCGAIDDAYEIFSKMLRKDTVSWNSMIMGLSHHGLADKVLSLFKEMLDSEMKPNSVTFLAVLSACSHSGLITRGLELFKAMKETYSIQPGVEHYISMIDLLGRAGKLREAEEFISTLPFTPDHTVYGALLGLCGLNWRDRDAEGIAKRAAMRLLELDPVNAPGHVALCNVYAGLGKHELEKEMRKEMGVKGVKKTPGCSWIVVNGKSNVFLSGDKSACEVAQMSLPIFCSNGMLEEEEEKVLTLCHC